VLFSVAVENVVAHPLDVIPTFERIAMAAGLALVLLAIVPPQTGRSGRSPMSESSPRVCWGSSPWWSPGWTPCGS
ncbi:MAG TPA: hypothetical protein VGC11_07310, partial [Acidimicrobiia bacterium]